MRSEKGQSLVEFAFSVMLLVLLLLGIIDFGRVFYVYLTIDNAGRETARAVSIGEVKTNKEIQDYAVASFNKNTGPLNIPPLTTGNVIPGTSHSSGDDFDLTITYTVTFLTPLIGKFFDKPLTNTTTMRVE